MTPGVVRFFNAATVAAVALYFNAPWYAALAAAVASWLLAKAEAHA